MGSTTFTLDVDVPRCLQGGPKGGDLAGPWPGAFPSAWGRGCWWHLSEVFCQRRCLAAAARCSPLSLSVGRLLGCCVVLCSVLWVGHGRSFRDVCTRAVTEPCTCTSSLRLVEAYLPLRSDISNLLLYDGTGIRILLPGYSYPKALAMLPCPFRVSKTDPV